MSRGIRKYRIVGVVVDRQTHQPITGLRVEAWDKDPLFDDLLGTAITGEQGGFQIEFDETYFQELFLDRDPDLYFRIFRGEQLIKSTEDAVMWNVESTKIQITLEVDSPDRTELATASDHPAFDSAYYKIGGGLEYQHPTYITRQADQELYQGLLNGEFCYVLNSRQMGKSSLRVQMMKRLQQEGCKCASIDMMRIGSDITTSEWYGGVVSELIRGFGLTGKINFSSWWRERDLLSPIQRLSEFIEDVLLVEFPQKIVIFIDEIDSILKFQFRNDFFAYIRTCYDKRAEQPDYQRLTFVFLGVATPSDLIADRNRTPFNIGRAIALDGFRLEEAQPLAQGLSGKVVNPQAVLREVLAWTGGQPFLTQKLCSLIAAADPIPRGKESRAVEAIVRTKILTDWQAQDEPEHLRTIRDRLLCDEARSLRLLRLYRRVLLKGYLPVDGSSEQTLLRLSGIVVRRQEKLFPYNRIYKTLFNLNWVEKQISEREGESIWNQLKEFWRQHQRALQLLILFLLGLLFAASIDLFAPISPASPDYFSAGERVLFVDATETVKQATTQISRGNYAAAITQLETWLQQNPNDPEALVYLNNARIATQPHHTIAVALPIANRPFGQAKEILRGVAQAQTEMNQRISQAADVPNQTIQKPLKVLLAKDEDKPNVAEQVATTLVDTPEVMGVVGHFSSDVTKAAAKIYEHSELVSISPTSTAVNLTASKDYLLRTVPDDRAAAQALVKYMTAQLQRHRAAVYYCSDSLYSKSLRREFTEALRQTEGRVVAEFDLTEPDFDPLQTIETANRTEAEVLVLFHSTNTRPEALEVVERNSRRLSLLAGDSMYDLTTLKAGEAAAGMVVAIPWVFQPEAAFAQTARLLWKADINWRTVTAYDATQALLAGLNQANPTRQAVQQMLTNPNFEIPGAVAPIRFKAGNRDQPMRLAIVQADANSKLGYVFAPAQ